MNTGHTTYTTFHAGETLEVIRRFTEEPIDAARSMFEGVDLVLNQESVTVGGTRQRRTTSIEEIESYDAGTDTFSVTESFAWDPQTDTIHADHAYSSPVLADVKRQHGWNDADLRGELQRRELVLAYLSDRGITSYAGVAATLQAYMATPTTVLSRIADDTLADRIGNLRSMRTIDIDVDEETEALVPRPTLDNASPDTRAAVESTLEDGDAVLDQYRDASVSLGADDDRSGPASRSDEQDPADEIAGAPEAAARAETDRSAPGEAGEPIAVPGDSQRATSGESDGTESGASGGGGEQTTDDRRDPATGEGEASESDDDEPKGLDALLE
jgi:flagellar protein FlaI